MAKKSEEEVRASNKAKQARYEAKNKIARKAARKILKTQVQCCKGGGEPAAVPSTPQPGYSGSGGMQARAPRRTRCSRRGRCGM